MKHNKKETINVPPEDRKWSEETDIKIYTAISVSQ